MTTQTFMLGQKDFQRLRPFIYLYAQDHERPRTYEVHILSTWGRGFVDAGLEAVWTNKRTLCLQIVRARVLSLNMFSGYAQQHQLQR